MGPSADGSAGAGAAAAVPTTAAGTGVAVADPSRPGVSPSAPRTARQRAREAVMGEILASARRHLASEGAAALSLRAVARDLGMVSSAVYRYVASRDELLTRLIVDAYDALGSTVEAAEATVDRADLSGRLTALCLAVRGWALDNPNEYALLYGSPVPGYVAPADTVGPASRVALVLLGIVLDAVTAGRVAPVDAAPLRPDARAALAPLQAALPALGAGDGGPVPGAVLQHGVMVWTALYGTVSFELFGHLEGSVGGGPGERRAFFDECVRRWAAQLGIAGT